MSVCPEVQQDVTSTVPGDHCTNETATTSQVLLPLGWAQVGATLQLPLKDTLLPRGLNLIPSLFWFCQSLQEPTCCLLPQVFMLWWHFLSSTALCGLLEKGGDFHLPVQDKMARNYEPIYIYVWEEINIEGCKRALEFGHMFIHTIFGPDSNSSLAEMKTSSCRAVPRNSLQQFSPGSVDNYLKL